MSTDRSHAMDHVVLVLFENRSLDNMLGRLYGPDDGKTFDGVIGKDLSNPIPAWAEHGSERKVVPYNITTDLNSPNPDSGEEYYHTNTEIYNTLDEHNRFKIGGAVGRRRGRAAVREPQDDSHGYQAQLAQRSRRADRRDGRGWRSDRRGVPSRSAPKR